MLEYDHAKTILVADDKANVRNLVREYLDAEGFRVVIAANEAAKRSMPRARKSPT